MGDGAPTGPNGQPKGPGGEPAPEPSDRQQARSEAGRHEQEALAKAALETAIERLDTDEETRARLWAEATKVMASDAERPEDFYDVMESLPSKYSGEDCETEASSKRRHDYHRKRNANRPTEAIGAPEGADPLGHHLQALDYTWTPDGREPKTVWNPHTEETEQVQPTEWVPTRYGMVPKSILYTPSINGTETNLLAILYDRASEWYLHKHGTFRVSGLKQATLAAHLGICRQHCAELLAKLEALGLIKRRSHVNIDREGADAVYFLHAHEPAWFEYPMGSPFSGRARLCQSVRQKTDAINWESVRNNEWVRGRCDEMKAAHVEQDGTEVVAERHRTIVKRSGGEKGLGEGMEEYFRERMPEEVKQKLDGGPADGPDG
jgi:hypothetical protein